MAVDPDLVEHLCRLEAELVSPDVWQSHAELEARMVPDFIEVNSGGILSRDGLLSEILGADPGVWETDDFVARELAPSVVLLTYRQTIDGEAGGEPVVAIRSSIWCHENGAWGMALHQSTRLLDPTP